MNVLLLVALLAAKPASNTTGIDAGARAESLRKSRLKPYNQMQMELLSNAPIPDGLLASMTLLSEKPRLGVPSRKSAPHQRIDQRNCTAVLGSRFRCSETVSGDAAGAVVPGVKAFSTGKAHRCGERSCHYWSCVPRDRRRSTGSKSNKLIAWQC